MRWGHAGIMRGFLWALQAGLMLGHLYNWQSKTLNNPVFIASSMPQGVVCGIARKTGHGR
jgi:hypothetical protein